MYWCLLSRPLALILSQGFLWYDEHWEYISQLISSMRFGSCPTVPCMVKECLWCIPEKFMAYPNVETNTLQMIPSKSHLLKVLKAPNQLQRMKTHSVLKSPGSRLEKDWDWTGPRPEKTRKNKTRQDWWLEKTTQKLVFMDRSLRLRLVWTGGSVPLIYPSKMSPRSPKMVMIWLRNKLNYTMLTKIVDFAEYYCIKFNS